MISTPEIKHDPESMATTVSTTEKMIVQFVRQREDAIIEEIAKYIGLRPGEYLNVVTITEDEIRQIVKLGLAAMSQAKGATP